MVAPGPGTVAGGLAGGVAGFVGGSMAADYAQDKALKFAGIDDDVQRAVNAEANPKSSFVGGLAPAVATMNPIAAGEKLSQRLVQRALGGATMGGFEAGSEAVQGQDLSPTKIGIATAVGVAAPGFNKFGQKLANAGERMVPGRPGRAANPEAAQDHTDVGDPNAEIDVNSSSLAQPAPPPTGETTGNPQSSPVRSERNYGKDKAPVTPENDMLSQGDMDPATTAALKAAAPEPAPAPQEAAPQPDTTPPETSPQPVQPQPAVPERTAAAINQSKRKLSMPQPSVEAGFPEPGEPVATGENEATKMPALKGEAPINASVSDAQKAAGNYPKARTHDFGKPMAVETHAGDERTGKAPDGTEWKVKLPYDYGYFNKAIGADKDHIDFARPPEGSPDLGDKHFIIDQKNAETGKFDEHKLFTYYKDEATARKAYEAGFSDGKGPDRLGAITEVTRPELVKFLAKHTSRAAKAPYGDLASAPVAKPLAERAVVKDLIEKGKLTPEALNALPPEQVEAAIAGKRTRKYGQATGASAGYPVEGVLSAEGKPVTANTKAKATERAGMHKGVVDWFDRSAPKKVDETDGELLDRLKGAPEPTWQPSHKPAEWMLAREARKLLKKPTPGSVEKFRDAERLLRGKPEDVENYRGGNRVEADIARSKRSGDEAITSAENKLHEPGVNSEEDAMIAAIDARRGARFDVPHEEAEAWVPPKEVKTAADIRRGNNRTVDVSESSLARRAEAAKLAGKKSKVSTAESEGPASKPREIKVVDEAEKKRIMEALGAATKKAASHDPSLDITAPVEKGARRPISDLVDKFAADTSGAIDVGKIKADIARALRTTDHTTYIAKKSNGPLDDYTRSVGEDLHRISQENRNHFIGAMQAWADMPKELNNPKTMEQVYHARDADSAHVDLPGKQAGKTNIESLPANIKALYDEHLKPIYDQNDQFVQNIRAIDPDRMGPDVEHHVSHITKGDTSDYNMLKSKDDPTSPQYNGISVSADAAKNRKFYALENPATGERHVIQPSDRGFTKWNKYKRENIKDPTFEFEDGGKYTVTPKTGAPIDYVMRQATTREIEANARGGDGKSKPMQYYKNAGMSAAVANVQLGAMARHLTELDRLRNTPEFEKLSTTNQGTAKERGWSESNLPNFKGTYMHPDLKAVFDDFAGHLETPYSQLNSAITKMLFWMPTAHLANVGAHWFTGRGWDNFTPKGVRSLVMDTPKAIKSVVTQDAFQMQMRREGAGTIFGSVLTRDMMPKIAKAFHEDIVANPSKWGPIADKLGVPLKKLGQAVYDASSKVMWAGNDAFMTQRVMELMRKGKTMREAIIDTERDIPNYRLPTKIIGSGDKGRQLALAMGDPRILSFGRYHYGMMNSYAGIVKDALGKDATAGDRLEAVGKLMATGMLGLVVFPLLDQLQKKMTGNEGATQQRRGPVSIPSHIAGALQGKEDVMSAARATATIPPLYQTILETLSNHDFRGKPVVEPGDVAAAAKGSAVAGGRAALQFGSHAARGLVSPLNTLSNAVKKDVGPLGALRDQATDAKNPSAKAVKYEKLIGMHNQRDSVSRFKHGGSDPLEAAYNRLFGYR
jgi:Inorganic Pyrophosphatase